MPRIVMTSISSINVNADLRDALLPVLADT